MKEGDSCPKCGGKLTIEQAIELGHIFKLGTFYSIPFEASFLDEDGIEKPLVMGSYGIGPGRVIAAIVEQHHDENGIAWPRAVAPYDVHVVALAGAEHQAQEAATALEAAGLSVLLDDRDERPGVLPIGRAEDQQPGQAGRGRGTRVADELGEREPLQAARPLDPFALLHSGRDDDRQDDPRGEGRAAKGPRPRRVLREGAPGDGLWTHVLILVIT